MLNVVQEFLKAGVSRSAAQKELNSWRAKASSSDVFTAEMNKKTVKQPRIMCVTDDELEETKVWNVLTVSENRYVRGMRVGGESTH